MSYYSWKIGQPVRVFHGGRWVRGKVIKRIRGCRIVVAIKQEVGEMQVRVYPNEIKP